MSTFLRIPGLGPVDFDDVATIVRNVGDIAAAAHRIRNGAAVPRAVNGRPQLPPRQAREEYERKHFGHDGWGRPPLHDLAYPVPDQIGGRPWVHEMGAITRIGYTTAKSANGRPDDRGSRKARDLEIEEFIHDFDAPRPLLCWSSSGLIIVRYRSTYTVEDEGIKG